MKDSGCHTNFNSRSHVGSDLLNTNIVAHTLKFQFTLPHRERTGNTEALIRTEYVSIHAPTQGAIILIIIVIYNS